MKVAYIAGPFRAPSPWEVELNCRRAELAALDYWRRGFAVICPHCNTRYFTGAAPDDVWLEGDLEIMRRCDLVVFLPGWRESSGCLAERAYCIGKGIDIVDYKPLDNAVRKDIIPL